MFAARTNWNLASNRLAETLLRHRNSGRKLLDLSAANPTECGFQYDHKAILSALQQPGALEYHPDPRGLLTAREAVSRYYAAIGIEVPSDSMILTTSTSEAYSFAFRLLANPGDEILIPAPSYPLFDFLADIQDVKPRPYPLFYDHGWHIDFHALEQAATSRTRAVVVVHPNNPTGHFTKPEEIVRLNEICASRQMAIIADEVFLDFCLSAERPSSFAGNRDALTFTLSGLSKICGLPQMKAAWLAVSGPQDSKTEALARLEVIADTFLSMNAPVQRALPAFLGQRSAFQEQLIARVRRNVAELDRQLAAQKVSSRLDLEGGWYAVLRVPSTRSDEDLALFLLNDSGVYVHPGHFYDFSSDGYLVVSLISKEKQFSSGLKTLLIQFH
jgi:alanine-synthesizing transaminase